MRPIAPRSPAEPGFEDLVRDDARLDQWPTPRRRQGGEVLGGKAADGGSDADDSKKFESTSALPVPTVLRPPHAETRERHTRDRLPRLTRSSGLTGGVTRLRLDDTRIATS